MSHTAVDQHAATVTPAVEYATPAPIDQQAALLSMIERVALDPSLPIERLNQLLDMKERIDDRAREERAREAEAAYYRAMAACQSELKVVTKNKDNSQTKSRYADLAALSRQADPIIHRHGFTTSFQPGGKNDAGEEIVRWTIAHIAGHIERGEAALSLDDKGAQGSTNKTKLHAFGSTMSYGRRYLKLMLFDIATGDDDDGNAAGKGTINEEQWRELRGLIDQSGADEARFLVALGANGPDVRLEDLPVAKFEQAKAMLAQKIKARANA